uniref:Uncharacterized protein n=1 Tax=Anguilla anguilla TaxID=7936 RepID=A0A0E9P590_ANGAN
MGNPALHQLSALQGRLDQEHCLCQKCVRKPHQAAQCFNKQQSHT